MNYQIIKDERKLKEFIEWLPELQPDEVFYVCLFARNKYCSELTHISSDKAQLKRFTATKDWLYHKIKQLEIEEGCYKQKQNIVPQEALALYINPNPRSQMKAAKASLKKLADLITREYNGYNVHQEIMSELQKAVSRKIWIDFDFDTKDTEKVILEVAKIFKKESYEILQTRGGLHILVNSERLRMEDNNTNTNWYHQMISIDGCDRSDDNMIPIPGCTQGNFVPYFVI